MALDERTLLEAAAWRAFVAGIAAGKVVGGARYVHPSALGDEALARVRAVVALVGGPSEGYDVLKLDARAPRLSLLAYPGFFEEPFPVLTDAWTIDLAALRCERRSYAAQRNPPILHRKELLLPQAHPRRAEYEALTASAERYGLFADPLRIGHRDAWHERLRARGLRLEGHALVALEAPPATSAPEAPPALVLRHRTAMARRGLSTPMQALWRHGYLSGALEVFDYGCGRGDDLAALEASGVPARGWDPHFRPDAPRDEADVVNLGFVLNVIEDPRERREALARAYALARRVLAVAVLLGGRAAGEQHAAYGDGVLTSRSTFQKYFAHDELGAYLSEALGREPVSVGPGLYFVFRSDDDEQDFLERRQRSSGAFGAPPSRPPAAPRDEARSPRTPRAPRAKPPSKWERNAALVDAFWRACLALGRAPRAGEFEALDELTREVGAPATVLRRLQAERGPDELAAARARRSGDLLVFLALNLFERRRSASSLGARVLADLRERWGSHARALEAAQALLFSLRDPPTVEAACREAAAAGLGHHEPGDALHFDARMLNELPPALRVFLGCAGKLYGEVHGADVVKVHSASGKVSLLRYDDYEGAAIPLLVERVKIDLRRQQVHRYVYEDGFEPQPLYLKARYLHPAMPEYEAQRRFDDALRAAAEGFDFTGFGPPLRALRAALATLEPPPGLTLLGPRAPRTP